MKIPVLCALVVPALFLPFVVSAVTVITPDPDSNEAWNYTWSKENGPYILDGSFYVRFGSLSIGPGTVVKFTPDSSLVLHGDVDVSVEGTAEEPVYVTSIRDDSVGGDTNEDGEASTPTSGDWGFVSLGSGTSHGDYPISYLKVRYGGGVPFGSVKHGTIFPTLSFTYQKYNGLPPQDFHLETIEVSRSAGVGLYTYIGGSHSLTIIDSSFYDNGTYGVLRDGGNNAAGFYAGGVLDARNNWWGDISGPYHSTLNSGGLGNAIDELNSVYGGILFDPWLTENPVPDPLPGSTTPDPVIIIPGILGSQEHNGEWEIDPILHTYDDLIATLDVNHYTLDVDLFTFPYDWRKSNVETAVLLKEKIDEVKSICSCDKVDLVAHSMGGLVARQYIQSDTYEDDVDQLIFLGTPHLGAPKAYLMWEGGAVNPPPLSFFDSVFLKVLEHEGYEEGYPSLFAYLRTEPIESVRELLSVEDYLFDEEGLRQYPDNYPTNSFLVELNSDVNILLDSDVQIHSFVGRVEPQGTITEIYTVSTDEYSPLWLRGYPEGFYENAGNPGLIKGEGDMTVPLSSASFIASNITETPFDHNALPTETEGDIFLTLTGEVAGVLVHENEFPNIRLILIKILSPADLLVVAPDGNKVGKENGQEVNNMSNAFYTGFNTNVEFITILNPLDGEYTIYTEGTDSGAYTVETAYISEEETVEASFTGDTTLGKITELVATVDNENPEVLDVLPTALGELLALLEQKVQELDIKDKLKENLLKKIENLEKKIEKKKEKNTKLLEKFENKVTNKEAKGKIDVADVEEILELLELLEMQAEDVTLNVDILAELKEKIESLDIKEKLKKILLKRVDKLENQRVLTKALSNLSKNVMKKGEKGKINDTDAQELLDLLGEIENAL